MRIKLIIDRVTDSGRDLLLGALEVLTEAGVEVRAVSYSPDTQESELVRYTYERSDGYLARSLAPPHAAVLARLGKPLIELAHFDDHTAPRFVSDVASEAVQVHRHLAALQRRIVGVIASPAAFATARIAALALPADTPIHVHRSAKGVHQYHEQNQSLHRWLRTLPPGGVVVATDPHLGSRVLREAIALGLPVPDQLAVLAIDDDAITSLLVPPGLSAVRVDNVALGRAAARGLLALMDGRDPGRAAIPALEVIERGSTRCLPLRDPDVAIALAQVDQDPARDWDITELAAACRLGRRQFERRFRALVGRSPADHLRHRRTILARQLLRDPARSVEDCARSAGFGGRLGLERAFAAEGLPSPARWRRHLSAA